ncbi:MAG TPA: hypothetical protein DCK95_05780 [Anaerolineaceae bacterium]|uniref:Putative cell division protein FtsQ n=1 Tax=Anaerolinea thermophila TaxID=167964 RepID=A0A124FN63_9CHLR|nr:MAG: Putative cell division protein FtsQ [Anaerolinea thermophila]HAF61817.1 hypothetical protein [Anaerolineaceae bacterium]
MKEHNRADSERRSDKLRQKRLKKQNEWLQDVNTRAEKLASRPAYESNEENQRSVHSQYEQNPLAHIALDEKEFTTPKLHLSWRFLSGLVTGICTALLISAFRSPEYLISNIEIEGLTRVTQEEITTVLDLGQQRIFMISPLIIENAILENFPELHDANVSVDLSSTVSIQVQEREPHIAWEYDGKKIWIDEEGYLLPDRGEAQVTLTIGANQEPPFYIPEERIILAGEKRLRKTVIEKGENDRLALFKVYQRIEPTTYQAVKDLNQLLPEQDIILYDVRRGLGWNDSRGFRVYVGSDLKDIAAKMNMVEEIVRTLVTSQVNPTMISVEQINAPYYRMD